MVIYLYIYIIHQGPFFCPFPLEGREKTIEKREQNLKNINFQKKYIDEWDEVTEMKKTKVITTKAFDF